MVRLHTRLVDFPPSCESAASQYRVGLICFESGRVLVVHGGVFECSSRMNGKPSSPVLREGWAPAMQPGHSTKSIHMDSLRVYRNLHIRLTRASCTAYTLPSKPEIT